MPSDVSAPHALAGRIVLIVEDDPIMLRNLVQWFQQVGCKVLAAHDGIEGMARFEHIRPDVVVTDILMPNREGVETLMAMKALAPEVKVLAISGGGRLGCMDLLNMAQKLGADGILPKPFRAADVVGAVTRLLRPDERAA